MASTRSTSSGSPPAWIRPYCWIPYDRLDCWQLVRHVWREERGVELPEWRNDFVREPGETLWSPRILEAVVSVVDREKDSGDWKPVEAPEPFDIALYAIRVHGGVKRRWHVALVAGGGWALNTNETRGSHPIRLRSCEWTELLEGYYRPAAA